MSHYSVELFRDLYPYMEWADATVWRVALASDAGRQDEKVRELLHHLHLVQRLFLALWTNQSPVAIAQSKASDFTQLLELKAWAHSYYGEVRGFLETADSSILERRLVMPWVKEYEAQLGMTFKEPSIGETMFQVVNHTTHHRAQVNARLRVVGAEPSVVDYIGWVWFGRPAANWEFSAA